jgi:acetyl-CoA carboxylase biotin carboxyl carrier protein
MPRLEIDEALLRRLAQLLQETGLTEIEYESEGQRVRVNRSAVQSIGAAPAGSATPSPAAGGAGAPATVPAGAVTSPMVGTVYLASEPGGAPFVKVGDRVKQGQTLLIIEAMKVMNPIPAPEAGTVEEILINDGQPVEYGEPLLVLR